MNIARVEDEISLLNERIEHSLVESNIGERFISRTFGSFEKSRSESAYKQAIEYAGNFEEYNKAGKGLIFMGNVGTGKTHLAAAIAHHLAERGVGVKFGNITDIFQSLRSEFGSDEDTLKDLKKMPLLVIDDLGKERDTEWQKETIYSIVNYRYERALPMIFTTNLTAAELSSRLGEATMSRVREVCRPVIMTGTDYRNGEKI